MRRTFPQAMFSLISDRESFRETRAGWAPRQAGRGPTSLQFAWQKVSAPADFGTGVSLHSHTLHSKELLDFIPRMAARIPLLEGEITRLTERFARHHGRRLDFRRGWWTPPLDEGAAREVEAGQITGLGLRALVSLTDHDSIAAYGSGASASLVGGGVVGRGLAGSGAAVAGAGDRLSGEAVAQGQGEMREVEASGLVGVELTVAMPVGFLHLGIHQLPREAAREVLRLGSQVGKLMRLLREMPETLVVLNHPLWDEPGIGAGLHARQVREFLACYKEGVHALELNGLRPWRENEEVIELAEEWGKPLISGGDRHGLEPNANINLTNARSLADFVEQVRRGESHVLFLPQYRKAHGVRIVENLLEILQEQPGHARGWQRWSDRVFYELEEGKPQSLSEFWPEGGPAMVRLFVAMAQGVRRVSGGLPAPTGQSWWQRCWEGLWEECRP